MEKFEGSNERLEDRQVLLRAWLDVAKGICPTLGGLLRICGAQLYSNAIGESNFSSVTRLLSDQRLRSGGKLLAAQLLASRARTWAQMKDPTPDMLEKAMTKAGSIAKYFPAASLPMGKVLLEEESSHDEVEEVDDVVAPGVCDAAAIATSSTTSTTASASTAATSPRVATATAATSITRAQRANRGARMAAMLSVIRPDKARGKVMGSICLDEKLEARDENSDSDYECEDV